MKKERSKTDHSSDDGTPEWARFAKEGDVLATKIVKGGAVAKDAVVSSKPTVSKSSLTTSQYLEGVQSGDRTVLARAITLIESQAERHREQARDVLNGILARTGNSIRIGITGVPGAGKSTFIERFGFMLCELGFKVAVLAVDPSSSVTRGSILGDKTRMERLASHPNSFIRPSPSGGTLGGVAKRTRESMLLCEAAGFDLILVETVGVGQSEVMVRSMVDLFLLLTITGAGDELQSIKKGVMELAEIVAINKADGANLPRAKSTRVELQRILKFLTPATPGWDTKVVTVSSLEGTGLDLLWEDVEQFIRSSKERGLFASRREQQLADWLHTLLREELTERFFKDPKVAELLPTLETRVLSGELDVGTAVSMLLKIRE